jgi:superfamily I DNA/RNA helicase
MTTKIILGPPGTGKTEYLLRRVEEELANDIQPQEIGYFSYTKKAAREARDRALVKFPHLDKKHFKYFRTLHSLAFQELGLSTKDVMRDVNYKELSQILGIKLKNTNSRSNDGLAIQDEPYSQIIDLARVRNVSLREQFNISGHLDGGWLKLKYIADGIEEYKKERNLFEFTDMIVKFNNQEICPELKVLIIDEAQDLAPIQWTMAKKLIAYAGKTYVAGDDDQSIYRWAGVDPDDLINLDGDRYILDQSWRVPRKIHDAATTLIKRVKNRIPKIWNSKSDEGVIKYHSTPFDTNLHEGQWLVLGRDRYTLDRVENEMKARGFFFSRLYNGESVPSVSRKRLNAINAWTDLTMRDKEIELDRVRTIYHYLEVNKQVKHGFKTMPNASDDILYTYDMLEKDFGLLVPKDKIWHKVLDFPLSDKVYIISLLRRKENLNRAPRITLSTIHGSKGGEADNVMLLTELPRVIDENYFQNKDDERRVFYVGMTRAKKELHIVRSQTEREFKEIFN